MLLFLKPLLFLQSIEDTTQVQFAFDSIENLFLYICSVLAIMALMLIPVILCFSMIDNYFKYHKYSSKIDKEICCHKAHYNEKQIQSVCKKYLKSYSGFAKNASGLAAWNIFSLIYIAITFADFKTGVLEYFNFPFHFINAINGNDILSSFSQFSWNWYSMLTISLLTLIFFK